MKQRIMTGIFAVALGMALNFLGDWALAVRIEIFKGIATFTFPWMVDIFLVPFIVGLVVAWIFGKHAKWLACLPPLFVRGLSYLYLYLHDSAPGKDFFFDLHLHYWGLCVILAVESANIGGILGEVWFGSYHRRKSDGSRITTARKNEALSPADQVEARP